MLRRKALRVARRRPGLVLAAVGAAVVVGGAAFLGAGLTLAQQGDGRGGAPHLQASVSLEDAQRIALEGRGMAQVVQVSLEFDDGRTVYSVDLSDGAEVEIDAASRQVISTEQDDDQVATTGADQILRPQVSMPDAQQIALEANTGASIDEIELERGPNGLVYKVELTNDVELTIDAATGAILQSVRDD